MIKSFVKNLLKFSGYAVWFVWVVFGFFIWLMYFPEIEPFYLLFLHIFTGLILPLVVIRTTEDNEEYQGATP